MHDHVIRNAVWARLGPLSAVERLLFIGLCAMADRDGIVSVNSKAIQEIVGSSVSIDDKRAAFRALHDSGLVALWTHEGRGYAWVTIDTDQPHTGSLARARDEGLPAPPPEMVTQALERLNGSPPTEAEAKAACPRAFGGKRPPAAPSGEAVQAVFDAWKKRQKRPGSCVLSKPIAGMISGALSVCSSGDLIALIEYAYTADDAPAKFWRGENQDGRTYLGLDNLLRAQKLPGRIQSVQAYNDKRKAMISGQTAAGGADLGPNARFRRRGGE